MRDIIVEIMVEVLTILAIATEGVKDGRFSELVVVYILPFLLTGYSEKYSKKLMGNREIEDSLERLDKLTREEARMASAEQLKMTHSVNDRVRGIGGQVQDVEDSVRAIDSNVRGVGENLDQTIRSSSL